MTRFWIHIEDAVSFMLDNYEKAAPDKVMIPPMKASRVVDLAECLAEIMGVKKFSMSFIGIRDGEKIHECLESNHDQCLRSDTADKFTPKEMKALLRRVVTQ
jgi:UDP-N-acetylglucosamine 4,6-dehydratase